MKKRFIILISVITLCLPLFGCGSTQGFQQTIIAMDTNMTLKAYGKNADTALKAASDKITALDLYFRRSEKNTDNIYDKISDTDRINSGDGENISDDTADIIKAALEISRSTDGTFDISVAPLIDLWGFYGKDFYLPSDDEIAAALEKVDYRKIVHSGNSVSLDEGMKIDLSGIAKGYASDIIADIFRANGVESGLIELGGNVYTVGSKPDGSKWTIAIQDPDDSTAYIGMLHISNSAVITSGGYQNEHFFEQAGKIYHHIIDPKTGFPADNGLKSVTIVSENGTLADGLSTALYVMGFDKAAEYWRKNGGTDLNSSKNSFQAVFVTDDGSVYITQGLQDMFESRREYGVIKP